MPEAAQAKPDLDFSALYLDTNVLVRSQWPSASVKLQNALRLASWWGIPVFLPEPVLMEAEQHWIRAVQNKVTGLDSAANQLDRISRPIDAQIATVRSLAAISVIFILANAFTDDNVLRFAKTGQEDHRE
jgi:hypothetical protein